MEDPTKASAKHIQTLISTALAAGDWTSVAGDIELKTNIQQPSEAFRWARDAVECIEKVLKDWYIIPGKNDCNQQESLVSLNWTLRIVCKTLEALLDLQHAQVDKEGREMHPNKERLDSLTKGVTQSKTCLSKAISLERQVKFSLALSFHADPDGIFDDSELEKRNSMLVEDLQSRECCCLSLIASGVLQGEFWYSSISMNKLRFRAFEEYDKTTQLLAIVLYASLNGLVSSSVESSSADHVTKLCRRVSHKAELPSSLANAIAAFWMMDNKVNLNESLQLISSMEVGQVLPYVKSQLSHFNIMNVLLKGVGDARGACKLLDTAAECDVVPSTKPEAQTLIQVLLATNSWERALLKSRDLRDNSQLPDELADRKAWQESLLELIFEYFLTEYDGPGLLNLVLTKCENDFLYNYLERILTQGDDSTRDLCETAAVVLSTKYLMNGRLALAAKCHEKYKKVIQSVEEEHSKSQKLLDHFYDTLPPHIDPTAEVVSLLGKTTDHMPFRPVPIQSYLGEPRHTSSRSPDIPSSPGRQQAQSGIRYEAQSRASSVDTNRTAAEMDSTEDIAMESKEAHSSGAAKGYKSLKINHSNRL